MMRMSMKLAGLAAVALLACNQAGAAQASGPAHADLTWLSIANMYFELGDTRILVDGYITRLPQSAFSGGGGGLARTSRAFKPDVAAVTQVLNALGGPTSVNLLLTGHSHFDHSFDTATWSRLTGAPIIGSPTTCFQAAAEGIPAGRCTPVLGGEKIAIARGVTLRIIRWNHSGSPTANPEQHDPVELDTAPTPDPQTGGLHGGVAEDFPNGGGSRALLFVVNGPDGRYSWLFEDSASAVDLDAPIIVGGRNYGAPIQNLQAALKAEGLESVDLWIGTGGLPIAQRVLPLLKPRAYLPVHWDGLWGAFLAGVQQPYSDPELEAFLRESGVQLLRPAQYLDKWRLDAHGIRAVANDAVRQVLGLKAH
jgi:L-ascorbate metabolism protein UlaG (beta-lactamase superfamily)